MLRSVTPLAKLLKVIVETLNVFQPPSTTPQFQALVTALISKLASSVPVGEIFTTLPVIFGSEIDSIVLLFLS